MVPPAEYERAHYAALTPRCSPYESDTKPGRFTWSPTKSPSPSAVPTSVMQSGKPQTGNQPPSRLAGGEPRPRSQGRRHLPPDVLQVAIGIAQPLEPVLSRGIRAVRLGAVDVHKGGAYARGHGVRVTAYVDHRTGLDEFPDLITLALDHLLDEHSRLSRLPRERHLQLGDARRLEVLQFIGVEHVALRVPAAVEQHRPPNGDALLRHGGTFLQEPAEGCHPGSCPDHDHRDVWVGRRPEGDSGLANKGELSAALHAGCQVVGGHPVEVPVTAAGRTMEHSDREMAAARYRGGGGDRVVTRPYGRQQLQVDVEGQVAAGEFVQQLEHRPPTARHSFAISLPAGLVEPGHRHKLGSLIGVRGVSG